MARRSARLLLPIALLTACGEAPVADTGPRTGTWRMELDLGGDTLPFLFDLARSSEGRLTMTVRNAEERFTVDDITLRGDSFIARPSLFDSEFRGVLVGDSLITGSWFDRQRGPDYRIPFTARVNTERRFPGPSDGQAAVAGKWRVRFGPGDPAGYDALGVFEQHGAGRVTGTFLTETGDHRFLEGIVHGDSMKLSTFDGSHAYYYKARIAGDSIHGLYHSGHHWQQAWTGVRDAAFTLRDADSLVDARAVALPPGLRFPDLAGDTLALDDARFKGKVLLVQVMGSWCPNCTDETRLLNELYAKHRDAGLEIVAIAFEKPAEVTRALAGLERFRETMGVRYTVLYGGGASKPEAASKLPFLSDVLSWPTTVFVGRDGTIRRVRTGFTGPGAGARHITYQKEFEDFVEGLLVE